MVRAPELVDHAILTGTATRLGGSLIAGLKFQMALSAPLMRLLPAAQLGALPSLQFGIPEAFRQSMGEEMKQVSPTAMTRFILAT